MVIKNLMGRVIIGLLALISVERAFGSAQRGLTISEEAAISSQPRSLRNLGATCYMNAGLQLLSGLRDFNRQVMLMKDNYLNPSVATDYISFLHQSSQQIGLKPAICFTSLKARDVRPDVQEDSHEYVLWLLDQLSDESLLPKFRDRINPIYSLYPGTALRRSPLTNLYVIEELSTVSHLGKLVSQKPEWLVGLDLAITGKSLEECLRSSIATSSPIDEYKLSDGTKVYNATAQKTLTNLSQYVLVHLLRGAQGQLRDQTPVSFPLKDLGIKTSKGIEMYNLVGFVMHAGGAQSGEGHYIAYTKNKDQWYKCDDSTICEMNMNDEVALIARDGKGRPATTKESSQEHYLPTMFVYEKQALATGATVATQQEFEKQKESKEELTGAFNENQLFEIYRKVKLDAELAIRTYDKTPKEALRDPWMEQLMRSESQRILGFQTVYNKNKGSIKDVAKKDEIDMNLPVLNGRLEEIVKSYDQK